MLQYFPEDKMENSSLQHLFLSQLPEAEIELPYLFSAPNLKSVHITTIEQYTVNGEAEPKIESQNLQVKFFGGYKKVNEETRGILTEYGFTSPLSETASESVDEDESEFEGEDFSSNVWTLRKGGPQIPEELEDLHEIECHVFQSQIRADDIADIKQYVNWKNSERACKEYVDFIGDRNKHWWSCEGVIDNLLNASAILVLYKREEIYSISGPQFIDHNNTHNIFDWNWRPRNNVWYL